MKTGKVTTSPGRLEKRTRVQCHKIQKSQSITILKRVRDQIFRWVVLNQLVQTVDFKFAPGQVGQHFLQKTRWKPAFASMTFLWLRDIIHLKGHQLGQQSIARALVGAGLIAKASWPLTRDLLISQAILWEKPPLGRTLFQYIAKLFFCINVSTSTCQGTSFSAKN